MGILDFFSDEAGQRRTAAMEQFGRDVGYYVPPNLRGLLGFTAEMTPSATLDRASQKSSRMLAPNRTPVQRVGDLGGMLSETAGIAAPAMVAGRAGLTGAQALQEALLGFSAPARATGRAVADRLNQPGPMPTVYSNPLVPNISPTRGDNGGPPLVGLLDALNARSAQMDLRPADRIQPATGGAGFLDRDYQTPAPGAIFDNLADAYPRNPDPTAALPKNDRARVLVDRREEIAEALARRIEATGQMDADTRYFYHSDGPLYRAAINAGLSDEGAQAYLRDLSNNIAATSPRTQVEDNLRNATLVMAKDAQGVPFRDVIGSGTTRPDGTAGISERGYPMMTGSGGIHGNLLDDVAETGTINTLTNPKPATFGPNLAGNRSGVTVDTHAIRGTLQTLNEIEPGAVPEGFILPQHRDAYAADPTILTPDMIDDTLANQMVGPRGDTTRMQTEYPVFADIWHDAADRLGVSPAEAQSMGWFGFGDQTNLGSARATPVDIFDERLSVTAQALGVPVDEAARLVFNRQVPLLGVGGLGLLGVAAGSQPAQGDGT